MNPQQRPYSAATRRGACLAFVAAALLAPLAAAALGIAPLRYSKLAFDHAVAAGEPVIVHFAAGWCPTCQAQKPVIQRLLDDPTLRPVKFFVADYDRELGLRNKLSVQQQSTIVVFKEGRQVARSVGETNREALAKLFQKAL